MLVVRAPLSLAGDAYAHASAWLSLKRLGDLDRGRANNLNLLRFVAATLVVFSHSWPLAGAGIHDPLARLQRHFDFGGLAVTAFFAMSGFLIARSCDRSRSWRDFAFARALRVAPAYVVAVAYATFVLGPLLTTLPVADYLAARDTWSYVATTLTFFGLVDRLPGVFAGNPYPFAVNGSLWTLAIEIFCYGALALAAAAVRFGVRGSPSPSLWRCSRSARPRARSSRLLPRDEAFTTPRLAGTFVAGALFYAWRGRIALSPGRRGGASRRDSARRGIALRTLRSLRRDRLCDADARLPSMARRRDVPALRRRVVRLVRLRVPDAAGDRRGHRAGGAAGAVRARVPGRRPARLGELGVDREAGVALAPLESPHGDDFDHRRDRSARRVARHRRRAWRGTGIGRGG
jgi:hypothetical protein